jgi:fermentation-respiration switch protein FrsA (DUF1100 family)
MVILVQPFKSISGLIDDLVGLGRMVEDRFDNLSNIKLNNAPLLVMHGNLDKMIPMEHGIEVFRAATVEPKRLYIMWNCSHTSYDRFLDIAVPVFYF